MYAQSLRNGLPESWQAPAKYLETISGCSLTPPAGDGDAAVAEGAGCITHVHEMMWQAREPPTGLTGAQVSQEQAS